MDVVCLGLMVCDILVKPFSKEIFERDSVKVDIIKMESGGDAFNVAVNLRKLGISSGIIAKIGNDEFGDFLMKAAANHGTDTRGVRVTDQYGTMTSVVLIHADGERSFASYWGACEQFVMEDVDFSLFNGAKVLVIGSAFGLPGLDGDSLASILERAQKMGLTTVMDVTGNPNTGNIPNLRKILPYTNIFMPSLYEAAAMTNETQAQKAALKLREYGAGQIIVKMGEKGALVYAEDEMQMVPALAAPVVDTTGAGDAFVSGYIAAYLKGYSPILCAKYGNAAGSLCVSKAGATTAMQNFPVLEERVKNGYGYTAGTKTWSETMEFVSENI